MIDALTHIANLSTPVLVIIGVLFLRYEIIKLKLWTVTNFVQKKTRIM